MKGGRLVEVEGNDAYSVYREVNIPCIPLGVDRGGYCCTEIPEAIKRLRRKKIGDKMWVTIQFMEDFGMFKATLTELLWNADKTRVSAKFCDGVLCGYTNPIV